VRINDVNPTGVLSMSAVPVFCAHEETRVFAPAMGVDAAKPVAVLWLKSLVEAGIIPVLQRGSAGGAGLEDRGYGELAQQRLAQVGSAGSQRTGGLFGGRFTIGDTSTSTIGAASTSTIGNASVNGMNPIDPRDFRTSSPPG
jgi:hypothetical protein